MLNEDKAFYVFVLGILLWPVMGAIGAAHKNGIAKLIYFGLMLIYVIFSVVWINAIYGNEYTRER